MGVCKGPCEWTSASIVMLYSVGFHNKKILIIKMSNSVACILYSTGYVVDQFTGGINLKYDALGGEVSLSFFVGEKT